jgi:hypothetical protein
MLGEFVFGIVLCAKAHFPICTVAKAKYVRTEIVHEMDCANRLTEFQERWNADKAGDRKLYGRVWAFCRPLHTEPA